MLSVLEKVTSILSAVPYINILRLRGQTEVSIFAEKLCEESAVNLSEELFLSNQPLSK